MRTLWSVEFVVHLLQNRLEVCDAETGPSSTTCKEVAHGAASVPRQNQHVVICRILQYRVHDEVRHKGSNATECHFFLYFIAVFDYFDCLFREINVCQFQTPVLFCILSDSKFPQGPPRVESSYSGERFVPL